jgi:predicted alpha/beta superfamily hydrolase
MNVFQIKGGQLLRQRIWPGIVLALLELLQPVPAIAARQDTRPPAEGTIEIEVRIQPGVDRAGPLFIAGNHPQLGNWRPDGLALTETADGLWVGKIQVNVAQQTGRRIEFKLTRGSWETVEKDRRGQEIPNRRFQPDFQPDLSGNPPTQKISVLVEGWAAAKPSPSAGQPGRESTVTGTLKLHPPLESARLGQPRRIAVWLPPGYQDSDQRYPVLYLHDGQNLFDQKTAAFGVEWQVDETATRLIEQGKIEPLIIVGIWNTADRIAEYTPGVDPEFSQGGRADDYLKFLVEELKPLVDRTYRTRPSRESTAIAGSSLGGLISLYACQKHPKIFAACAAISPSLGWNQESLLKELEVQPERLQPIRVWIDMGTSEGRNAESQQANVARVERLGRALESAGSVRGRDFQWKIIPEGKHHEGDWAERFGEVLEFLYPPHSSH